MANRVTKTEYERAALRILVEEGEISAGAFRTKLKEKLNVGRSILCDKQGGLALAWKFYTQVPALCKRGDISVRASSDREPEATFHFMITESGKRRAAELAPKNEHFRP